RWLHLLDLTPSGAGEAGDTRSQRSGTIAEDRASLLKREPVMQSPTSRDAGLLSAGTGHTSRTPGTHAPASPPGHSGVSDAFLASSHASSSPHPWPRCWASDLQSSLETLCSSSS